MAALAIEELAPAPLDPVESAREAGLRYVSDSTPGITRKRAGSSFTYLSPDGKTIRDREDLNRIKRLAIPPAWTDVWICPSPRGHLQATGRDVRGRKQYRYHPRYREVRDETKYGRMIAFAAALPKIRERVDKDLAKQGLPREKVLATVVRLLETTLIRVGNEEYARTNKSFGLTTMRDRHVDVKGSKLFFRFRGKAGKEHKITLNDSRLARIVKRCRDIPGSELFQYLDEEGTRQTLDSGAINEYLREITGQEFTAKDFRTWAGTILAAMALSEFETVDSEAEAKRNVVAAIENVAEKLGNTTAVCRKCYIHPAVIEAYMDGTIVDAWKQRADEELTESLKELSPEEAAVTVFLSHRLAREEEEAAAGRDGGHKSKDLQKALAQSLKEARASRRQARKEAQPAAAAR
ncbi:MAG: DNA topoisomerase IB [Dehalococcoidia bacterium]